MYSFDEIVERRGTNCIKWDSENQDTIPLWIADMDFECLPEVEQAIIKRAIHQVYGYTFADEEVYQAIIDWQKRHHDIDISKEEIILNTGVVYALYLLVSLFVKEDEKIIVQPPVYPPFFNIPADLGREVVFSPLIKKEKEWVMDFAGFEKCLHDDKKIKMYILCNPHNPTGKCYSRQDLSKIAAICQKYNVLLVSDEIHGDIIMPNAKHTCILNCVENFNNVVVFTAPTKTFNLAGLKISYTITRDKKIAEIFGKQAKSSGLSSVNIFAFEALKAVYKNGDEWLKECNQYIYDNFLFLKDYLQTNIPRIKFNIPEGTYLAWLDFSDLNIEGDLNERLKNEAKVQLNNGSGFYSICDKYQRMNVACPRAQLEQGLQRIKEWMQNNHYI